MCLMIVLALLVYATRLAGFFVTFEIHPFGLRFLKYVPIAIFASFVVPGVIHQGQDWAIRLVAAIAAALVTWRYRKLWSGFVVGMGMLWVLLAIK